MEQNKEAVEARARLGATMVLSIQLNTLTVAVRALIDTHPDRDLVREKLDQLIGQMLAHPAFLSDQDQGIVLRDFVETLFQPPVEL